MNPSTNIAVIYSNDVDGFVNDFLASDSSKKSISKLESNYVIPSSAFNDMFKSLLGGFMKGYISGYNQMDQSFTTDQNNMGAPVMSQGIDQTVNTFMSQAEVTGSITMMAGKMTEAVMQKEILTKVGELTTKLMQSIAGGFNVDANKIASAFKFDLSEDELKRIMNAMMGSNNAGNANANLISLGYQDLDEPTSIAFYFKSFDSKENVINFIDDYNEKMEDKGLEEKVLNYTDATGILMSSVKKVVNSVSYVLIAFVSISLVVSSIMIGIITYISVIERTKEIGILRAIGASKRNISSIFNAETFIIGLLSGVIGIGITLLLIPIINAVIHSLTGNTNINATIPLIASFILIILSIILTLIGGLIPSKKAYKQDPVIALRSE
jgi:ABC-type antimicrobial peptide transport system permease subunit